VAQWIDGIFVDISLSWLDFEELLVANCASSNGVTTAAGGRLAGTLHDRRDVSRVVASTLSSGRHRCCPVLPHLGKAAGTAENDGGDLSHGITASHSDLQPQVKLLFRLKKLRLPR
jgi:hypothetical protein